MKGPDIVSPTAEQLEFKDHSYTIEKFKEIAEYIKKYNTLKFFDTVAALLAVSNIAIQYFINEYLFYGSTDTYDTNETTNILCFINLILVITLCIFQVGVVIVIRYRIKYKILNLKYDNYRIDPNEQSLDFKLVLELFICLFFLPPYLNYSFKGTMLGGEYNYHLGEIMLLLMIPRLYLVPRLYEHYSKWTGFKAKAVCKIYSAIPDAVFAIKSDLKDRSFLTIGVIFTFLVVSIGIAIMQAERHFTPPSARNLDMSELTNNEWMIFVTMATIGYGEIFPTTHHGRFLAIIACVGGMFLFSITTVTLNNFSQFDKEQSSAYLTIKNKQNYEKWTITAANVIKFAFKCAKYEQGSIARLKMAYLLKQSVFEHARTTNFMRVLSVTSSEMLRELQKQAETKLSQTKKIIFEVPKFKSRSEALSKKQEEIEIMVNKISEQQKIIFDYVSSRYPDARVPLKIGLINLAP